MCEPLGVRNYAQLSPKNETAEVTKQKRFSLCASGTSKDRRSFFGGVIETIL